MSPDELAGPETAEVWARIREGVLPLRRCHECGVTFVLPLPSCPGCAREDLTILSASGGASLYSWTVTHHAFDPDFGDDVPYVVGAATTDEGARVLARVEGIAPDDLAAGMRLTLLVGAAGRPPLVLIPEEAAS